MRSDVQYRIVITKGLREISSIKGQHVVALMMEDAELFYLLPKDEYYQGKFIGFLCVDEKGRICLRKIIEGRENKNIIVYVDDAKVYIKLVD